MNSFINDENFDLRTTLIRILSFYPWFIISIVFCLCSAFLFLRYSEYKYSSASVIQIIDKANQSEMALPTEMTIFNRSMINLENEISIIKSYNLNSKVVNALKSNVKFSSKGIIKSISLHPDDFFDDYKLDFNIEVDKVSEFKWYEISFDNSQMIISEYNQDSDFLNSFRFNSNSTFSADNNLPFDFVLKSSDYREGVTYVIEIFPFKNIVDYYINELIISPVGNDSDQLTIAINHPNSKIAEDYLNRLIYEFDKDGISDRQVEYQRTIDFADKRSQVLSTQLQSIELQKQNFKEKNNLSDIKSDAEININQQIIYDSELFNSISQRDLLSIVKNSIINSEEDELMPVNIGIENQSINQLISEYNLLVIERNKFSSSAGEKNSLVKNLTNQLYNFKKNIIISIQKYDEILLNKISNLESKEKEFASIYLTVPENEKILRSIERELEVKESLFLLLLQKREEAAINLAVVKPTIKIIDSARSSNLPVTPKSSLVYFSSILLGIFIPLSSILLLFYFDNKVHSKDDLQKLIGTDIPILGEVPFLTKIDDLNIFNQLSSSRLSIVEASRMIISNLNFILSSSAKNHQKNMLNNVILITSAVKGEGKTLISSSISTVLSQKSNKVLLIGADLRNPQIHKLLKVDKSQKGLADYIYRNDLKYQDLLLKKNNLDIFLSGTIPPNPSELLASEKFKNLLNDVSQKYDYVIIDSAPVLLVADTFEISGMVQATICVFRSNHTDKKLCEFIKETKQNNKFHSLGLVFNAVGNSAKYGYKYGYQYGYQYGYKYSYNYGYGYGYSEDEG